MTFKVGDVVEVVAPREKLGPIGQANYGRLLTVTVANVHGPAERCLGLGCYFEDAPGLWVSNRVLRLHRPPAQLSSWTEIESLTHWSPQRESV